MYNITINLIACDEHVMSLAARDVLLHWAVAIDTDRDSVVFVCKNVLLKKGDTRLFIIHVGSSEDLPELNRLHSLYPGYPILALVDKLSDPSLVMKCIRAGALEVTHSPVLPQDLQEALDCIAVKHQGLSKVAQLITVTSAVGGCGGTAVATNLAYGLGRLAEARCILMELALRKGVLANHLNVTPRYSTFDLVNDIDRLDSRILQAALTEVADNLSVLVGPYESIQAAEVDLNGIMKLIQLTQHLARWLVLDVPGTFDDLFFRTLLAADRIVLVADQTVASLRGAQMVCNSLGTHRPTVVINRYDQKKKGLSLDRIQDFLPGCDIHTLANDRAVFDAMNSGQPLYSRAPRSPVLADIDALILKLEPDAKESKKKGSILSRIGRVLTLSS